MKIQHLRFLAAVVEHGGVLRAAEALHVSQPAVSAGLRALEQELGQPLFDRPSTGRRLRLRPNAERFHHRALAILRDCDIARAEFASGAGSQLRVRLGVLPTLSDGDVGAVVARAQRDHPDWNLEIWEGGPERLSGWLRQGRIDAAWTLVTEPGPRAEPLWREAFVVLAPHDHPAARRQPLGFTLEDLRDAPFVVRLGCEITGEAREMLRAAGVQPKFVARAEREEIAIRLVTLGLGVTIAPSSLARSSVAAIPLAGFHLERAIGLRWSEGVAPELPPALQALLSRMHRTAEMAEDA